MHNYSVPSKYNHITRIGNWSEEWELEQTKLKDYLKAKETGTLKSIQKENNLQKSLAQVELSPSTNGKIRFGDKIMLYNYQTEGVLACDVNEKVGSFDESYAVTTARGLHPCSRSVYTIQRYAKETGLYDDDFLHYGQKFMLQVTDQLYKKELFLASLAASPMRCAKFSRFNEVHVSHKNNIDAVWSFDFYDSKRRFEQQGQEVLVSDPVLIKHVLTSQWLGSDNNYGYPNQFGSEFEVFGHTQLTNNKTQILGSEKGGKTTIDIPCRNQLTVNHWNIVAKDNSSENK